MKPRTKLQLDVIHNSHQLYEYETQMIRWAKGNCLQHVGYATRNRVVCMDCGGRFSSELVKRKKAVCPHCGTNLKIVQSRNTTLKQTIYPAYAQVHGEYQVVRYFEIISYHKAGTKTRYFIHEILQHWVREDGKHEVVAKNHTLNFGVDSWNGEMEIRKDYTRWGYSQQKYDPYTEFFHPNSVFKPMFRKYGINRNLAGITFIEAIKLIPKRPNLETLLKAKQYHLLGYLSESAPWHCERLWPSIKICIRNKYKVLLPNMWEDYIDLLRYFGKDLHNAKYVCPKNLKAEHDRLVAKKRKIQERNAAEDKRRQAQQWEQEFIEKKAHLLGVCIVEKDITIKTLDSVQEYMEEGDKLHHCVFTNEYFLKDKSLCLSARIDNQPVETIELNLESMKIEQCYGKRNKPSEYHDRILNLVRENMPRIAKIAQTATV